MEIINEIAANIWAVYLDTAFWLLLGLIAAGLVKAYIPADAMQRWLGGRGFSAVARAALFGAPLPLCSCGVLPAALGLRRAGASKEATVSFLISTPETSIDSVAVTYALMGPVMAVYRPIAALLSALLTGLAVALVDDGDDRKSTAAVTGSVGDCCSEPAVAAVEKAVCCGSSASASTEDCCGPADVANTSSQQARLPQALRFAGAELLDDISRWLALGIVVAGLMISVIPPGWLAQWGGGLSAMLVLLLVGIPMYICATASTPIAAGLLLAGVSPGAVLVFLLVGPATNIAGLIVVRQELGSRVTLIYLAGIALVSVLMGLLLEWLLQFTRLDVEAAMAGAHDVLPAWLSYFSALLLLLLVVPAVRNRLFPFMRGG
jgi:uncharacterized membrane protein YraQ (UPF0718 family)